MIYRNLLLYVLAILLSASCELATAGMGTVTGEVYSLEDGLPLKDVSVIYGDSAVYTDDHGRFVYVGVPDGTQAMTFKKEGYGTIYKYVSVPNNGEVSCDAELTMFKNGWAVGAKDSEYGVILYTEDAGASWVRQGAPSSIPNVKLNDVCVVDDKTCWIVGDFDKDRKYNTILYTADAGKTWTRQGTSISGLNNCGFSAITSKDGITAWATTNDTTTAAIISATKKGATWRAAYKSKEMKQYTAITTPDGKHIWACGTSVTGTPLVEYSADAGSNWISLPVQGESGTPNSIYALDTLNILLAGSGSMGILKSSDGGQSWQRTAHAGSLDVYSLEAVSENNIWACGELGYIFHSDDGFSANSFQFQPAPDYAEGKALSVSFLRNGQYGAAILASKSGATGNIINTTDGGNTWKSSNIPFNFALSAVDFVGGNN